MWEGDCFVRDRKELHRQGERFTCCGELRGGVALLAHAGAEVVARLGLQVPVVAGRLGVEPAAERRVAEATVLRESE